MQLAQHGAAPDSAHSLRHTHTQNTHLEEETRSDTQTSAHTQVHKGTDTSAHLLYLTTSKITHTHTVMEAHTLITINT